MRMHKIKIKKFTCAIDAGQSLPVASTGISSYLSKLMPLKICDYASILITARNLRIHAGEQLRFEILIWRTLIFPCACRPFRALDSADFAIVYFVGV